MKVDELLEALAKMRQSLMVIGGVYDAEQTSDRMHYINAMRDYVLESDNNGFTDFCQRKLAQNSDLMEDILTELWDTLGLNGEELMWDEFAIEYLQD